MQVFQRERERETLICNGSDKLVDKCHGLDSQCLYFAIFVFSEHGESQPCCIALGLR